MQAEPIHLKMCLKIQAVKQQNKEHQGVNIFVFYCGRFLFPSCIFSLSVQNMQPSAPLDFSELDSAMQQQERIMSVSHALASEASRKSKLVAG